MNKGNLPDFAQTRPSQDYDGFCRPAQDVCDQGMNGVANNGCDDLIDPSDDTIWNMYDQDCVQQTGDIPLGSPYVYDNACCLSFVVGSLDVYEWAEPVVY